MDMRETRISGEYFFEGRIMKARVDEVRLPNGKQASREVCEHVGGVGVLGTFAAFGLFLYGVSLVGSVRGSLLGVAEPAGAMIIAAMWLHTPFSAADWAGLVLMAAMIVLVSLSGRSVDRRTDTP